MVSALVRRLQGQQRFLGGQRGYPARVMATRQEVPRRAQTHRRPASAARLNSYGEAFYQTPAANGMEVDQPQHVEGQYEDAAQEESTTAGGDAVYYNEESTGESAEH